MNGLEFIQRSVFGKDRKPRERVRSHFSVRRFLERSCKRSECLYSRNKGFGRRNSRRCLSTRFVSTGIATLPVGTVFKNATDLRARDTARNKRARNRVRTILASTRLASPREIRALRLPCPFFPSFLLRSSRNFFETNLLETREKSLFVREQCDALNHFLAPVSLYAKERAAIKKDDREPHSPTDRF